MSTSLAYPNGSTRQYRRPSEAFFVQDRVSLRVIEAPLEKVVLDPNRLLPDMDRNNNTWTVDESTREETFSEGR